jgi:2-polyprenyl-3-methyl-5-hydroxy-6-metoxy-1,4-benzoquinol methylase
MRDGLRQAVWSWLDPEGQSGETCRACTGATEQEDGVNSDSLRSTQAYWDAAAETYEQKFSGTTVGKTRRQAVWRDLERLFHAGQRVLELNCGTGIDAVFLARKGVHVLACDIAPRMIELAQKLAATANVTTRADFRILPTEHLSTLREEGRFDGAFSNFSGLNCVEDLSQVARDLSGLLKPGAPFLMCMMGRFVPWEIAWFLAHGRPKQALLRLREDHTHYTGTAGASGATDLEIQRPSVAQIAERMGADFRLRARKGIGITVPPSYTEHWARRFPRLIGRLAEIDRVLGPLPLFRSMADCVLLEFERRGEPRGHANGA